jgi:hypothetical protein
VVQRHRVVDAVAEERDVLAGAAGNLDDPRLLIGADPGEYGRRLDRGRELIVIDGLKLTAADHAGAVDPDLRAYLGCHQAVVARYDLDLHAEAPELGDGRTGVCLRPVGEGQEAG